MCETFTLIPLHKSERMERSRRQPVVSAAKQKATSALEVLKAAREGKSSRVKDFEVKEEAALYDVVSEADYAALAAKRRAEGGAISNFYAWLSLSSRS